MRIGSRPSLVRASFTNAPYGLLVSVVMALSSVIAAPMTSPDLALSEMPTGAEYDTGSLPHAATPSTPKRMRDFISRSERDDRVSRNSPSRHARRLRRILANRQIAHGWYSDNVRGQTTSRPRVTAP